MAIKGLLVCKITKGSQNKILSMAVLSSSLQVAVASNSNFFSGISVYFSGFAGTSITRKTSFYQSPLILTALLHVDLINIAYLKACAFIRSS